eukprot:Plantae.Rhodophyta-Rhodochaete_pulchella.ctg18593.p1 GENE.Plantae.Rhodophyta-Rhodochaete_pulchella.ctg18593~~Plantae.Rhodophyta-Rhodochaete_pulchella.ctg18593.p1  ORF type:complete len:263 (-),score=44.87 Plantae.Rhodophyta-Rhodochaete_pulchella.ctg18593:141-929(-)
MFAKGLKNADGLFSSSWWIRDSSSSTFSPLSSLKESSSSTSLLSFTSSVSVDENLCQEDYVVTKAKRRSFEEEAEVMRDDEIAELYVRVLGQWCDDKEPELPEPREKASLFFSVRKPGIPLDFYVRRVVSNCHCSKSVYVLALVYLDRLARFDHRLRLSEYNVHRMLITAILLAAKYVDDTHYSNAHFARVGGVPSIQELNKLELAMLTFLSYDLNVDPDEFEALIGDLRDFRDRGRITDTMVSPRSITTRPNLALVGRGFH